MLPDIWHLKYLNFAIGVAHACSRINSIAEIPISKSADCTNRLIWHAVYRLITLQIHLKQTVPGIVFCVCVRGGGGGGHGTGWGGGGTGRLFLPQENIFGGSLFIKSLVTEPYSQSNKICRMNEIIYICYFLMFCIYQPLTVFP